ncbi:hypothetical protein GALL_12410 [mine drainage metagenome]|uniref:SH3b domain-containing protein n=1 Tax=mine drainage metagenome TaxID=410659 RepID=A0A1J5TD90_9ZZZZ
MKTKLAGLLTGLVLAFQLHAAVLTAPTPVYIQPATTAAVVSVLNAGSTPSPSNASGAVAPQGWMAVDVAGPFVAYIHGRELDKNLNIRPNAPLMLRPSDQAAVLTHYVKGMKIEVTGIRGHWMQVRLKENLVGYIQLATATPDTNPLVAQPQSAPASYGASAAPQPIPAATATPVSSAEMPRTFQGKFVATRHFLGFHRAYDFQLNDNSGSRFAFLDLSHILVTDVLDRYLNQEVIVYGIARDLKGSKDIVIEVESIQLR